MIAIAITLNVTKLYSNDIHAISIAVTPHKCDKGENRVMKL